MTIDKAKLKALAQKVADLEDQPELESEYREAYDELWQHMHCHTILSLLEEIEQLRESHEQVCENYNRVSFASEERGNRIDQLKAEVDALRKDAERYRWLCDGNGYFMEEEMLCGHGNDKVEADARIDQAMSNKSTQ